MCIRDRSIAGCSNARRRNSRRSRRRGEGAGMKDLTQGSIVSHILTMAPPIFAGMIMIMLCGLIDLYFVSGLGEAAVAGVAAGGNGGLSELSLIHISEPTR